jgi:hypothetical protein
MIYLASFLDSYRTMCLAPQQLFDRERRIRTVAARAAKRCTCFAEDRHDNADADEKGSPTTTMRFLSFRGNAESIELRASLESTVIRSLPKRTVGSKKRPFPPQAAELRGTTFEQR